MPLRLNIKRKLTARSDRVKCADLHPTEPWMVISLYSGTMVVWNHETQTMVKTFEGCNLPVRVAKFVARKHWIVSGADDMLIHVFNYNTLERVHMFEAHTDYIRGIAVHPTQPYILSCSDDMLIKLWDWDRKWMCCQVYEGHIHYVMDIVINPKDNNQFATASLDRTIKVWQLGSKTPNFTLEGHEKGVNCIDYYSGGDKPYLVSGADDHLVKIWDYQNKTCVQTLEGHTHNVTCVHFHPQLPIILTGSEDGTVRVWHCNTYRLENTLSYGMDRVWCICGQRGSNNVALGYDEGSIIIKLGREEPAMSMDFSGKVMWARHSEVQQANLKAMGEAEIRDGEKLLLGVKDIGSCEIYPQTIQHSPNGRFVVMCGDGEYIIYTAMALRNKSFGSALEFVWAHDSSQYAIIEGSNLVKIFRNFKEKMAFKPEFGAEGIFGGFLLGVRSKSGLAFYDWESTELIRRIEIQPKHIFWSDSGELVCIAAEESFFVLRYLPEKVAAAQESKEEMTEDGMEDAFEVLGEVPDMVKTGVWVGDCFIYTSSLNRLNYYVGGEIVTIAHLDRTMYLLGFIPKDSRLYLGDKELNVISYSLMLSVLEYQTAVMRRDFSTADKVLPTIPREQRIRVAYFLEKQGFKQQALAVSTDPEHKFDLALQLGEVEIVYQLALEAESEQKWKQLAELATTKCQFSLAQECLLKAQDYGGLLLLATASGSVDMVEKLAEGAEKNELTNMAFLTFFLQGRLDKCLDLLIKTDRLPEAAFLARTYLPSHVSRAVRLWKESLSKVNQKAADALADPTEYSNLFPGLQQALQAEQYLKETAVRVRPAAEYPFVMPNEDRNVQEEAAGFEAKGDITELEPQDGVKSMSETVMEAAVTEAVSAETAVVEELIPPKPITDPLSKTEEESTPTSSSSPPVTVTEEHVEPKQEELLSSEDEVITKSEEASVSVEEEIMESTTEMTPTEQVKVQSCPIDDVALSVETGVHDISPAADVVSAASESEAITATEETPWQPDGTENIASDGVPVSTSPTVDISVTEAIESGEKPVNEEVGTDTISSEAPLNMNEAAEETCVTEELVSETSPPVVPVEELIPPKPITDPLPRTEEESTPTPSSSPPVTVTEEHVELKQEELLSSEDEVITKSEEASVSVEEEIMESTTEMTPTEQVKVQSCPIDDVALSVETGVHDISPAADVVSAASESEAITATEETPWQPDGTENIVSDDVLVSTSPTVDISVTEAIESGEKPVNEEVGTDTISSEAPLNMNEAAEETCVTEELVSETSPPVVPVEELISFENTDSPALDGPVQVQTVPELAFDPLLEPFEDAALVLTPVAAQEQEKEPTKIPVKSEDNPELAVTLQAEPGVLSPGAALEENDETKQEACLEDPAEDLETELKEEALDDLDLDSFDLEDIDTTGVDLDSFSD